MSLPIKRYFVGSLWNAHGRLTIRLEFVYVVSCDAERLRTHPETAPTVARFYTLRPKLQLVIRIDRKVSKPPSQLGRIPRSFAISGREQDAGKFDFDVTTIIVHA